MLEATISVMLMGIVMVGALQTVGAAQRRERDATDRVLGQQLASALMNEILVHGYKEPDSGVLVAFGLEAGEATGNRSLFDDVDDYSGWTASPPQDRFGNDIPDLDGWTRAVSVAWADPTTLASTSATNTGLKKITVTTSKGGQSLGCVVGYRSIAWVDTMPVQTDANGNGSPVAVMNSSQLSKQVGQAVSFAGNKSSDPDGDSLTFVWDFGDGTSGTGTSASHSYMSAGCFTCTLTVTDGRGGISTASLTAVISAP